MDTSSNFEIVISDILPPNHLDLIDVRFDSKLDECRSVCVKAIHSLHGY